MCLVVVVIDYNYYLWCPNMTKERLVEWWCQNTESLPLRDDLLEISKNLIAVPECLEDYAWKLKDNVSCLLWIDSTNWWESSFELDGKHIWFATRHNIKGKIKGTQNGQ